MDPSALCALPRWKSTRGIEVDHPYAGTTRKLVLALAVQRTKPSSASCRILGPGDPPVIHNFSIHGACPNIVYYDKQGNLLAFGAGTYRKQNAIDVLANFLDYLFQCARMHIEESHACVPDIWASFGDNTDLVLSHPKERQGPQQAQIRRAAAQAGSMPDIPEGQARIGLVTEAKQLGNPADGFMAIDTGETTININSYYVTSSESPSTLHEIAPAECRLQGSFLLTEQLHGSRFGTEEYITLMKNVFDKTTKFRSSNSNDPSFIHFGTVGDRDPEYNIPSGQLKLPGDWLFSSLKDYLEPLGLQFSRPDSHINKAVVGGAVAFYLDHHVLARVAKYGTHYATEFNKNDEEHLRRATSAILRPSGRTLIPNAFCAILRKGVVVSEAKEFQNDFIVQSMSSNLCTIYADTSFSGLKFYRQQFSIVLKFELTELKAQI
ncbi:hypothetical protein BKA82DRAFT_4326253 [Pisolithus tinctorius]|nr:hypothetical protein BKA82DRAFT_4326253 [Pisolithus tinctorius]